MNLNACFEQGPIRPPSEARSLLIRPTRNCPWNKCAFCHTYRDTRFQLRPVEEIKKDIDAVRDMADAIGEISWKLGQGGRSMTPLSPMSSEMTLCSTMPSGTWRPGFTSALRRLSSRMQTR